MPETREFDKPLNGVVKKTTASKKRHPLGDTSPEFGCLCICIFLPTAEGSIVSTSLVTTSADLSGFGKNNWLITVFSAGCEASRSISQLLRGFPAQLM
ncbi:hypothetical protein GGR52DRAFT_574382 [Hypoxylon sp. FL1284]|nr:hypothetical protein GGR52DRAFT_574382 [Hypoxylon sp. FL1284]